MDPRFLKYYNRELQFIREMGGEFAREYPKIAGRLGLDGIECADPYVERLFEGFAFLAARVQLKLDAEFPRFTENLLEMVYPNYLAPVPSMAVVQFNPHLNDGALAAGFSLPRKTVLKGLLGRDDQTACEYRTSNDVVLWPIEVAHAEYFSRETPAFPIPKVAGVRAALQLKLKATAGLKFDKIPLDKLVFHLHGADQLPFRLHEQLLANCLAVVVRSTKRPVPWQEVLKASTLRRFGYQDDQALLPVENRSFQGYRLLQEYFSCPQRFLFVEFTGLAEAIRRCPDDELEIVVLFNRHDPSLERLIDESNFRLGCTPAVNLFPRRADRIHLSDQTSDYHVIADRTRPVDFEVHSITRLTGFGSSADELQKFLPFYAMNGLQEHNAFYTLRRIPRVLPSSQRRTGARSTYVGSETYVSLVDGDEGPFRHNLRQLAPEILCTNRDLPLMMPVGQAKTDFTLETSAPVVSTRCLTGPTRPRGSIAYGTGESAWKLVSQLSLNYLSLVGEESGAGALRELLELHADPSQQSIRKQIDGLVSVVSQPIVRRLPVPGPITCGRGVAVAVTFNEAAFEGAGVFTLASVLDEFFARYVSLNSFTETSLSTLDRGEIMKWPIRVGRRVLL
ncbi:MAG: type VI secretion system baseplate subunit TssF [Planctomycetota bacterium]|nr:type VI secretion system baseplate subunit TssF [Planctomycetota bacterium]